MKEERERAILAGLNADIMEFNEKSTEDSLDELEALVETAGGECIGRMLQSRPAPDPHSLSAPEKSRK